MLKLRAFLALGVSMAACLLVSPLHAADSVENFYKGSVVRVVVPFAPGGSYDRYAQLVARHLGKQIPGTPNVVLAHLPGAGGLNATNQLYNVGPFEGKTIGILPQGTALLQAIKDKNVAYDATKFHWLGSVYDTVSVVVTWHASNTKTLADAKSRETLLGGLGAGTASAYVPLILNDVMGTKFKVINGYNGGSASNG